MRRHLLSLILGAFLLFDLLSRLAPLLSTPAQAGTVPRRQLTCRHFAVELECEEGGQFETGDATSPIGKWVSSREATGWRVATTDLEIGQKATGYMHAWTQVCLERES